MPGDLFTKRDLIAYFLVAATGALLQLLIGSLAQSWFTITYKEALTLAYIIASLVGFFLTKVFAFNVKNAEKSQREMIKFTMVTLLSFAITVYGSDALFRLSVATVGEVKLHIPFSVKLVQVNKLVSQTICMGISFLSNYILHKRFTFYKTGFYERLKRLI
jgi:putative flippase GtrA